MAGIKNPKWRHSRESGYHNDVPFNSTIESSNVFRHSIGDDKNVQCERRNFSNSNHQNLQKLHQLLPIVAHMHTLIWDRSLQSEVTSWQPNLDFVYKKLFRSFKMGNFEFRIGVLGRNWSQIVAILVAASNFHVKYYCSKELL